MSLSLGTDCVWAVDDSGGVHLRLGSLSPPSDHGLPVWVPVDPAGVTDNCKIVSVACSTEVYPFMLGTNSLDMTQNIISMIFGHI